MTDRTNSPSQDARGTAREPNPSPDQMVSLLKEWPRDNRDAANWLSAQALMHTAADLLTRLSAESQKWRDECREWESDAITAQTERGEFQKLAGSADNLACSMAARAERAESERDSERDRASSLARLYEAECVRAINAEAELSALKARVAEVLGPFKGVYRINEPLSSGWPDNKPNSEFIPGAWPDWSDFRRAAELHATLSGEQK